MVDGLTPKQEIFAIELSKGKSQREAYKAAYNCGNMKDHVIDNKGYLLANKGEIRVRLKKLQDEVKEKAVWEKADMINDLKAMCDECKGHKKHDDEGKLFIDAQARNVAINAIKVASELLGYKVDKHEVDVGEKLEDILKDIRGEREY